MGSRSIRATIATPPRPGQTRSPDCPHRHHRFSAVTLPIILRMGGWPDHLVVRSRSDRKPRLPRPNLHQQPSQRAALLSHQSVTRSVSPVKTFDDEWSSANPIDRAAQKKPPFCLRSVEGAASCRCAIRARVARTTPDFGMASRNGHGVGCRLLSRSRPRRLRRVGHPLRSELPQSRDRHRWERGSHTRDRPSQSSSRSLDFT
jgi:hypothetical protein